MAQHGAVLSISCPASTGIVDYPLQHQGAGESFVGKMLWVFGVPVTTSGTSAGNMSMFMGFMDSAGGQFGMKVIGEDLTDNNYRIVSSTQAIVASEASGATHEMAGTCSWNGTNLRINWTDVTVNYRVTALVLGPDVCVQSEVTTILTNLSADPKTGMGFQGNAALAFALDLASVDSGSENDADVAFSFGAAYDDGTTLHTDCYEAYTDQAATERHAFINEGDTASIIDDAGSKTIFRITSFTSDGFGFTSPNTSSELAIVIVMDLVGLMDLGAMQKDSSGTPDATDNIVFTAGNEFSPTLMALFTASNTSTSASAGLGVSGSIGATDGNVQESHNWTRRDNANDDSGLGYNDEDVLGFTTDLVATRTGLSKVALANPPVLTHNPNEANADWLVWVAFGLPPTPPSGRLPKDVLAFPIPGRNAPPYTHFGGWAAATPYLGLKSLLAPEPKLVVQVAGGAVPKAHLIATIPGRDTDPYAHPSGWTAATPYLGLKSLLPEVEETATPPPAPRAGVISRCGSPPWFDRFHVVPNVVDAGVFGFQQTRTIHVINANTRRATWSGLGDLPDGVTIPDLPALPFEMDAMQQQALTVTYGMDGTADIDALVDIDATDDVVDAFTDAIDEGSEDEGVGEVRAGPTLQLRGIRVNLFVFEPEAPIAEEIQFDTGVIEHGDGSEQRIAKRANPRQIFSYTYVSDDVTKSERLEALLFRLAGSNELALPMWHELRTLTAPTLNNDTSFFVNEGRYADWRQLTDDSLIVLIAPDGNFEVMPTRAAVDLGDVNHILCGTIDRAFPLGTIAMPVRRVRIVGDQHGERFPVNRRTFQVQFRTVDNSVDLSSEITLPTLYGNIFFPDHNFMRSATVGEEFFKTGHALPNTAGKDLQLSRWQNGKRRYTHTFRAQRVQGGAGVEFGRWQLRATMHTLRGQQKAFYIRQHSPSMEVVLDLVEGEDTIRVEAVDYGKLIEERGRKIVIRIEFVNGAILTRHILSSETVFFWGPDGAEELTVDGPGWPPPASLGLPSYVDAVKLVEYVGLFRLATDSPELEYGPDTTFIEVPLVEVFDEE